MERGIPCKMAPSTFKSTVFLDLGYFFLDYDDASLNEKCANVAIVVTSEICRGTWIAWRGRNYKAFCSAIGQVPQNGMLAMSHK